MMFSMGKSQKADPETRPFFSVPARQQFFRDCFTAILAELEKRPRFRDFALLLNLQLDAASRGLTNEFEKAYDYAEVEIAANVGPNRD